MNVASLELCKELYELSGWNGTQNYWKSLINHAATEWKPFKVVDFNGAALPEDFGERTYPAYDLGYLLRKLRENKTVKEIGIQIHIDGTAMDWSVTNMVYVRIDDETRVKDTDPTNAVCKLAIELFRQGVLTKGGE